MKEFRAYINSQREFDSWSQDVHTSPHSSLESLEKELVPFRNGTHPRKIEIQEREVTPWTIHKS